MPTGFVGEIEVGGTRISFLDLSGEIEFTGFCIEIEVFPVERDQLTDAESRICENVRSVSSESIIAL